MPKKLGKKPPLTKTRDKRKRESDLTTIKRKALEHIRGGLVTKRDVATYHRQRYFTELKKKKKK